MSSGLFSISVHACVTLSSFAFTMVALLHVIQHVQLKARRRVWSLPALLTLERHRDILAQICFGCVLVSFLEMSWSKASELAYGVIPLVTLVVFVGENWLKGVPSKKGLVYALLCNGCVIVTLQSSASLMQRVV